MIESATLGKIDLILTKEISRFSRNTVDSIKYTEYLLKNGVIVYFLSDNLNTKIIATRQEEEFRARYEEWRGLTHIEVNEEVWEALDFDMESVG